MTGRFVRWVAPVALAAAVHSAAFTVAVPAFAQAAKQQDLIAHGRSLFDDQQYEESIQTLSAALVRPNNTKDQKIEIYRLLALNYITLNHKEEAESAVRGLLSLEPEYSLPASESPRFRDFFSEVQKKWEAEGRPGLVTAGAAPTQAPVDIQHRSPSQVKPDTDIPLTIKLEDPQGRVQDVKLFYRTGSKGKFSELETPIADSTGRATIPHTVVKPPLVEYYFQGFDKGGLPIASRGDAAAPLRVAVPEPSKGWLIGLGVGAGVLAVAGGVIAVLFATGTFGGGNNNATVSVGVGE